MLQMTVLKSHQRRNGATGQENTMSTQMTARKQAKWLAGAVASIANVLLLAGVIGLAGHYARTAADVQIETASVAQQAAAANRNS
jgi:hypothetical protein